MFSHLFLPIVTTIFISANAQAVAPLCSVFFERKIETVDVLNKIFDSGEKQKILHVSVDRADNFSKILRLFKSRVSRAEQPGFSIFLTSEPQQTTLRKLSDQEIPSMAQVSWGPNGVAVAAESFARPSQHQISIGTPDLSFVPGLNKILKLLDEGKSVPLEGVYIHEGMGFKDVLFREKLDLVLQKTGAVLYGVSSGSPGGLKRYSNYYEVAFAGKDVVEFSDLKKQQTNWFSLEESRSYTQQSNIRTRTEFEAWQKHFGIPNRPEELYRDRGWQGWDHFLGYGKPPQRTIIKASLSQNPESYEVAHEMVRQLGFFRIKQYHHWWDKNRPEGIPRHPNIVYANAGWQGWETFLGRPKWATYEEFVQIVIVEAGIRSGIDFKNWLGRPAHIPSNPFLVYKQFQSWGELLKNPELRISPLRIKIKSYQEVQSLVAQQKFKTVEQYRRWKKPEGVPYDPDRHYQGKGWIDWSTFLGKAEAQQPISDQGRLVPAQN